MLVHGFIVLYLLRSITLNQFVRTTNTNLVNTRFPATYAIQLIKLWEMHLLNLLVCHTVK